MCVLDQLSGSVVAVELILSVTVRNEKQDISFDGESMHHNILRNMELCT